MPTYDYSCTVCGHVVELMHSRDVPGPAVCTVCGGPMRKLVSAPSVVFKGTGWAKRDRAASRTGSAVGAGSAAASTATETTGAKSDGSGAAGETASGSGAGSGDGVAATLSESAGGHRPSSKTGTPPSSKPSKEPTGGHHGSTGPKAPTGGGPD